MDNLSSIDNTIPDGGLAGWMIVAAVALINMTNTSITSVFGLLFGSQLRGLEQETFVAALISNLNSLALNFSGLFIGPAIKSFRPRNVATCGCLMVSFGLFVCSFATQSWHYIVGYSFFVGMGIGLIAPSTFMSINAHFSSKRGRAVGVSLAGGGVGQLLMPHMVRYILDNHGFRFAVLTMSLVSLFGIIGALMLKSLPHTVKHNNRRPIRLVLETEAKGEESKCGKIHEQTKLDKDSEATEEERSIIVNVYNETVSPAPKKLETTHKKLCLKLCHRLVDAMDLELLKDPIFWSIIIGMGLVYTSTMNFTMLFPNFLQYSVGLSSTGTATCMSVVAGADIVSRLLLPCITDKLHIPYRIVFLMGTAGLLIARTALAESVDLPTIIAMSIFTGMTKSATVLNNNLTISGHCRQDKLAGGLGLNMISKGVLVITVGQFLGWIRDHTQSYILCLHAQNILLLLVVLVWTPEIYYRFRKQEHKEMRNARLVESAKEPEELAKINAC